MVETILWTIILLGPKSIGRNYAILSFYIDLNFFFQPQEISKDLFLFEFAKKRVVQTRFHFNKDRIDLLFIG